MNVEKFDDWKKSIIELNRLSSKIDSDRDETYRWLATEIRSLCREHLDLPVRDVAFSKDGSIIQVRFECDTNKEIAFTRKFLDCIIMPFSVKRELNDDAEVELFMELYPLGYDGGG